MLPPNGHELSCRAAAAVTPSPKRNAANTTHPSKRFSIARSAGYSRQRNPFLHPWFRTGRETFDLIRLLSTRAFVTGTPLEMVTHPRSLAHALSGLDSSSGLQSVGCDKALPSSAIRPNTHSVPMPSRVPALRQPIPGITLGLRFLGHPTPSGLTAWSPAPETLHFVQGKLCEST